MGPMEPEAEIFSMELQQPVFQPASRSLLRSIVVSHVKLAKHLVKKPSAKAPMFFSDLQYAVTGHLSVEETSKLSLKTPFCQVLSQVST
jgi:hypothetical protein